MNNAPEMLLELNEAHAKKAASLEKTVASSLKENFQLFQANYRAFYELMLQKGLIKPDPYKNERHLSDIRAPDETPMGESEVDERVPILLSEYDNLLDFLISYTPLDVGSINLKKIKVLSSIAKYIEWTKLTPTNTHILTRSLGVQVEKVKNGNDQISSQNIQSTINRMDSLNKEIMKALKVMTDFKREEYKLQLRQKVIQSVPAFQNNPGKDEFQRLVKNNFTKHMEGEAFYPELVQELFSELYEGEAGASKAKILEKFRVEEVKKKSDTAQKFNLREILMDGLRSMGTASRYMDESVVKLIENNEIIKTRPRTFMERFKLWIVSLAQSKQKDEVFDIELIDMYTSMKKHEKIQFNAYCTTVQRKARYLASFLVKTSATYVKLETASEDQIYDLLERNMLEIKSFHDTLDALDAYFKTEAPPSERNKLKGIKVELGSIKNSIAGVNQKMHEYVARKEEMEQLKKLGINVDQ